MVFGDNKQVIRGFNSFRHRNTFNITYYGQQEAEITSLSASNGYLYVLRKSVKTIDVYKIAKCEMQQGCSI